MGLLQKFQVKDANQFFIVNCPEELKSELVQEGLTQHVKEESYNGGGILLFVHNSSELNSGTPKFLSDKAADNHWVAFPKRTSKIPTDLSRDHGWDTLTNADWIPVRQVSVNEQWSALRFRPKANVKEIRRGTDYPGIDSKKKIVTIPEILDEQLTQQGLKEAFVSLSFTKRKEAVISILEAKKPETLERRINKILESLV